MKNILFEFVILVLFTLPGVSFAQPALDSCDIVLSLDCRLWSSSDTYFDCPKFIKHYQEKMIEILTAKKYSVKTYVKANTYKPNYRSIDFGYSNAGSSYAHIFLGLRDFDRYGNPPGGWTPNNLDYKELIPFFGIPSWKIYRTADFVIKKFDKDYPDCGSHLN